MMMLYKVGLFCQVARRGDETAEARKMSSLYKIKNYLGIHLFTTKYVFLERKKPLNKIAVVKFILKIKI